MITTFADVLSALDGDTRVGQRFDDDGSMITRSFDEVLGEARSVGARLAALGMQQGDRVGLMVSLPSRFLPIMHGCLLCGFVPVPMYPSMTFRKGTFLDRTAAILRGSGARWLVTDDGVVQHVSPILERVPSLEAIVTVDRLPAAQGVPKNVVTANDVGFIQYTSGSTADPKGVVVTHGSLVANSHAIMVSGVSAGPDDVGVSWLPLFHDMGLIGFGLAPLLTRTPVVFLRTSGFVRNPSSWLRAIHEHRGTLTFAPNFAYSLAAKHVADPTSYDLSHVRMWGCGAEPVRPETLDRFEACFAGSGIRSGTVAPCYGLAEATLAVTFTRPGEPRTIDRIAAEDYLARGIARPATAGEQVLEMVGCGRPLAGVEVDIIGPSGEILPPRTIGEIVVGGPSVARGYHEHPDATREIFGNGKVRTGDKGYIADGMLYVSGRLKDVVILRGRNYDPQTIESLVARVPGVRADHVVAIGCPGEHGEDLVVVAETDRQTPEIEAIRREVKGSLGIGPSEVVLLPSGSLPKTTSGKLQRATVRQRYLDGTLRR